VAVELASVSGLALAGDYLRGAAIEACARSGAEAAASLVGKLATVAA
jgi:predicted NAD/FAD-dependent oxidoreductase